MHGLQTRTPRLKEAKGLMGLMQLLSANQSVKPGPHLLPLKTGGSTFSSRRQSQETTGGTSREGLKVLGYYWGRVGG